MKVDDTIYKNLINIMQSKNDGLKETFSFILEAEAKSSKGEVF